MTLELWAGPECTVNRVGDTFHDQMARSGFAARLDDIDRLAGLGIARMRFPIVWERTERVRGRCDWAWSDERLARLRERCVAPIAGLVHHGSGPPWTDLLDPAFPALLAAYAGQVAERYPDIDAYTPVNEPLTTARFSGLYGLWHPHRSDDKSFVRCLLHEIQGTVLAMRAIRAVNPRARLVQTEDLGHVTASPRLAGQAAFENVRRWLTFDLLTGRVGRGHAMWPFLRDCGATEAELQALRDEPCPPGVIGINGYLTSERHLDDEVGRYPGEPVGGNGRDRYVDVEAVRVSGPLLGGFEARLRETCERYGLPVAITEVHLGCTRDEQARWLHGAWSAAQRAHAAGLPVQAVTCWAAFGSFDWNSLVTRDEGCYEPGLWDVRSDPPRPTLLATLARQLAQGETPTHPVLDAPGWWERDVRLRYPPFGAPEARPVRGRPVLITGGRGTLGRAFARICEGRGHPHHLLGRADLDIADAASVDAALQRLQPWAVINAAGYVRVDEAEHDARQWRENVLGPEVLAQACARDGVRLVTFSTDLVFDGAKAQPYLEADAARPLNAYGAGKREAELCVGACAPGALIVRTAAFFGPWDQHNFVTLALAALQRGETWPAAHDQCVSPTYVPDLAHAVLDLLLDGERGVWHLANRGAVSWYRLAAMAAEAAGLPTRLIEAVRGDQLGHVARRPPFCALGSMRGSVMADLDDALPRYLAACAIETPVAHRH